jgi:hypothetical protein
MAPGYRGAGVSTPSKWVIDEHQTVRITGRHRPHRGTIGGSGADRGYRMSTYDMTPQQRAFELLGINPDRTQ